MDQTRPPRPAWEVFLAFLVQGLTAFGGPGAHIGYFHREFVERRRWLSDSAFADLLAMAQVLPGPASSQLGMAIGLRRAGYPGLLAAGLGFTLPAGAAMIAFAYVAPRLTAAWGGGVLHGLQIAAAAVVLNALVGLARTLAIGPIRAGMAMGAAVGLILVQGPVAQILAMAAGAIFGLAFLRDEAPTPASTEEIPVTPSAVSNSALIAFALLLGLLPFLAAWLQAPSLGIASVFYRAGALMFGGGHLILPLLQGEVVGRGWVDQDQFLAGYGAMQALPGPLLGFAGFVGATAGGWTAGVVALLAIVLPSLLLVAGIAPWWDRLKTQAGPRAALSGVSAVVVGVLAAALWSPIISNSIARPADWALFAAAYVFLAMARFPPWLVVVGFATATGFVSR